ncbi:hypothetical protein FH972_006382 [Carpinus fangiana]|uniref:F-box associated beta-propeller type 1 domain-containing protein n=1 Tax=Carpinus fangiana TaxID=176857 RepID=A0A5N6QVL7_9ROSI|nr:hypothetical protein FH972_006382 [Carpinus fangiana]
MSYTTTAKKNILLLPKTSTVDYVVSMLCYETLQVSQVSPTPVPPPYFGIMNNIIVLGSCNGLICLLDIYALLLVIWNPAIKETKVVPKSNLPYSCYRTKIDCIGFGFDAKTNDYKIIKLVSLSHPPYEEEEEEEEEDQVIYQKEIYSLSADSWRKVDGPRYTVVHGYEGPMTYINGMAS